MPVSPLKFHLPCIFRLKRSGALPQAGLLDAGLFLKPGLQFPYRRLFGALFSFQPGQLGTESGLFLGYYLKQFGMMGFLLGSQFVFYFLYAGLRGRELVFAHTLLLKETDALYLPGSLKRTYLGRVVGVHGPDFLLKANFKHIPQLAVVFFRFAFFSKVFALQLAAADLHLLLGLAHAGLKSAYSFRKVFFARLEGGLERGKAALIVTLQLRAQPVIFLLCLRQAACVLAFHLKKTRVPAFNHGALVAVQFLKFIRVFALQVMPQAIQLGLFFQ